MIVAPFAYEDMFLIRLQPMQAVLAEWVTEADARALEAHPSFTGWIDGTPVGCAGIIPQWQDRAIAWAYLSAVCPPVMVAVHKAVARFLASCDIRRIETSVHCDFAAGHRWAVMLGFEMEAPRMRAYGADGHDAALYARVTR